MFSTYKYFFDRRDGKLYYQNIEVLKTTGIVYSKGDFLSYPVVNNYKDDGFYLIFFNELEGFFKKCKLDEFLSYDEFRNLKINLILE